MGTTISKKKTLKKESRRDFLVLTAGSLGAVGVGTALWPFVHSMNPDASVLALSSVEIDISSIAKGQAITAMWRGKPLFIRHRTDEEILEARRVSQEDLIDPESDEVRTKKAEWLVVVGVCTHLGCIPIGNKPTDKKGDYGGWFCPCHGSHYDTSGRIRLGPAPRNLEVPPYEFIRDSIIKVG